MINLHSAESLVTLICILVAYMVSATLTGVGQAWIAKKMGDPSGEQAGLLTLNPLAHINHIGTLFTLLLGVGWRTTFPVNHQAVQGRTRHLRLALIYGVDSCLSLCIALLSLVILIISFGPYSLGLALQTFFSNNLPLRSLTTIYPDRSSLAIVGALFLLAFVFFNVFVTTFSIIINSLRYVAIVWLDKSSRYAEYSELFSFLAPLTVMLLFAHTLRELLAGGIVKSAWIISSFLGVM
jgi:hypothetical protein